MQINQSYATITFALNCYDIHAASNLQNYRFQHLGPTDFFWEDLNDLFASIDEEEEFRYRRCCGLTLELTVTEAVATWPSAGAPGLTGLRVC